MIQSVFHSEENLSHARGTEWSEYTAGTDSGASATHAAETGVQHKVFWATFYSDADSVLTIKDGSDVIWEGKLVVATMGNTLHVTFPIPLIGTAGNAVSANVASSTADCAAALGGFSDKSV